MLVVCAFVYGLLSEEPGEQQFGVSQNEARIELYLQPMVIDPVNETMEVRLSVLPARSAGDTPTTVADRDLVLMVHRGSSTERVHIRAHQPLPHVTFGFDADSDENSRRFRRKPAICSDGSQPVIPTKPAGVAERTASVVNGVSLRWPRQV